MRTWPLLLVTTGLTCGLVPACGGDDASAEGYTAGESSSESSDSADETSTSTSESDGTDTGPRLDVGFETDGTGDTGGDVCKVNDDMDAVPPCTDIAPPDSFEPEVQWEWEGPMGEQDALSIPLVANLTDDNDDGEIDLCDTPDVLVVAIPDWQVPGHMHVLDGETGVELFEIDEPVNYSITPAIGDIDGDGLPEIVGSSHGSDIRLAAYEHDGTLKWKSTWVEENQFNVSPVALADLDADGDVEIISGVQVFDHDGNHLFDLPEAEGGFIATVAVDLDGDEDLELIYGKGAYHHDGTPYFVNDFPDGVSGARAHVADLDDDGLPEILMTQGANIAMKSITVYEHDGSIKFSHANFISETHAAIHDFTGDGTSEFVVSSVNGTVYGLYEADDPMTPAIWENAIGDMSGWASGTAFDFLGDAGAEAIFGDETTLRVFDIDGTVLMETERTSGTQIEFPVVADIDNDQSAEIVVTSNEVYGMKSATVQVIRDKEDRWIPARRIWNQHAYHVTNVREDGTIPQFQPKHWHSLNTFRTQAQVGAGGGICEPEG